MKKTEYKCWCGKPLTKEQHAFTLGVRETAHHLTRLTRHEWQHVENECGERLGVVCLADSDRINRYHELTREGYERLLETSRDLFSPELPDERIYAVLTAPSILGIEYAEQHGTPYEEIIDDTVVH